MARLLPLLLAAGIWAGASSAQTLNELGAASAAQGSLQNMAMPSYSGALNRARSVASPSGPGTGSGAGSAGPATTPGSLDTTMSSSPTPGGASVNGRWISVCPHGMLCQWQLKQVMGLR